MTQPLNLGDADAYETANRIRGAESKTTPKEQEDSLLELDPKDAARRMLKDWDDSWRDVRDIKEQWRANKARAQGFTGISVIKRQDRSEAYIPLGAKKSVGGLNKAARLVRRLRAVMFADPPMPEAVPAGDTDEARDAAETSTRVLQDQTSEGNLSLTLGYGDAFDLGGIYGSGFVRFWVDPAGRWVPKQVEASPNAQSPDEPFPDTVDPILRYVTEGGRFTEDKTQAARQWVPKICREILTGKNVRLIPWQVRDLWEADGAMIGCAVTLGEIKRQFPWVAKWPQERIAKLVDARPQHFNDLLPAGKKDAVGAKTADDAYCFLLTRYHVQSAKYPEGAYLIAAGSDELLYPNPEDPTAGDGTWFDKANVEPLDIPLTQLKQLTEEENPYGKGVMEDLGPGNEIRAQMLGSMLEHLDRFNNRRLFVPLTSTLQPHQLQSPTGTPIPILPGGQPIVEEIPDFPRIVEKMLEFISADMDDESGLQQVGQALNPPSVKSGLHANVIREQVTQDLSDLRENCLRGIIRGWRIILQLLRAYFTEAQRFQFQGPDGAYKVKRWQAADLGDTRDVRLLRGSFTQLTPMAKAEIANQYAQAGLLAPPDLEHVIEGNIGGLFGLQDNPHRQRVRRQIATWEQGPPADWQPPEAPIDPQTGQPPMDPETGQPLPPSPDPVLMQLFDARPVDTQPDVAQIRVYEIGRAMSSTTFTRWPPAWQQGLVSAYQTARQAAQVPDAEQAQQMQQDLQKAQQELNKPKVSFAIKGAELDQQQTAAVMAQSGIAVPPPSQLVPAPPDPREVMAVQERMATTQAQADVEKHRTTESAAIERERIKAAIKEAEETRRAAQGDGMMSKVMEMAQTLRSAPTPITMQIPVLDSMAQAVQGLAATTEALRDAMATLSQRPTSFTVTRDASGKVAGVKPEETGA